MVTRGKAASDGKVAKGTISQPLILLEVFLKNISSVGPCEHGVYFYCCSVAQLCLTLCDPMDCSMPGFPVHHQLLELAQLVSIELVMPSNHLALCHPLPFLPSIFPSTRVFSKILCIRWPKYGNFSFSVSPSNEYSGLISFKIDWFDLLAVQGTHKSSPTPQFKSSLLNCLKPVFLQLGNL